jgi:hypothetical protein
MILFVSTNQQAAFQQYGYQGYQGYRGSEFGMTAVIWRFSVLVLVWVWVWFGSFSCVHSYL